MSFSAIRFIQGLFYHVGEPIKILRKKSMGPSQFSFPQKISWIETLFIQVVTFQACS